MARPNINTCFVVAVPTVAGCVDSLGALSVIKGATVVAMPARPAEPDAAEAFQQALTVAGLRGGLVGADSLLVALGRIWACSASWSVAIAGAGEGMRSSSGRAMSMLQMGLGAPCITLPCVGSESFPVYIANLVNGE
jgi:hypothetical protein